MANSGDAYSFDQSTTAVNQQPVYTSKQWGFCQDQNNGVYGNNSISWDLSTFYNSGRLINPPEMVFVIPIVITLSALPSSGKPGLNDGLGVTPSINIVSLSDGNVTDPLSQNCVNNAQVTSQFYGGMKAGHWHVFNSLQIQFDGKDIIQQTQNISMFAAFKAQTTWSQEDVSKYGELTGYIPDSSTSYIMNNDKSLSPFGFGVCNNNLPPLDQTNSYPNTDGSVFQSGGNMYGGFLPNKNGAALIFGAAGATASGFAHYTDEASESANYLGSKNNEGFYKRMMSTNRFTKLLGNAFPSDGDLIGGKNVYQDSINFQNLTDLPANSLMLENFMQSEEQPVISQTGIAATASFTLPTGRPYLGATPTASTVDCDVDSSSKLAFRQTFITAVVRAKDICDIFEHLPLTRGLYMRIIAYMNTGNIVLNSSQTLSANAESIQCLQSGLPSTDAANSGTINLIEGSPYYQFGDVEAWKQNTFPSICPIMIAPLKASACVQTVAATVTGTGVAPAPIVAPYTASNFTRSQTNYPQGAGIQIYPGIACDSGTVNRQGLIMSMSIVNPDPIHVQLSKIDSGTLQTHPLKTTRIYMPMIELEPHLTSQYITNYKQQAIYYNDLLSYVQPTCAAGNVFSYQLGSSFVNTQRIVILPFYGDASIPLQFRSPWDSAPATFAPESNLTNFNVLVSNITVFQQQIDFVFQNYIQEVAPTGAINGGLATGLNSGLTTYSGWQGNQRCYVVDVARRLAGI